MKTALGARRALPCGLLVALAITLLGRALLPLVVYQSHDDPRVFLTPDSHEYLELAESLAASATFATEGRPELRRLPGFPLLLAIGARAGHPVAVTLIVHLLLGMATTVLCFWIAESLAGRRAGAAAAVLFACATELWIWSSYLLSETLFVFLFSAMLFWAVRHEKTRSRGSLLLAIALACGAAYVRVVGYLLPFALLLWFALSGRRDRGWSRRAAAALAVAVALLGAWHVRNGVTAGYWGFSSQVERALYFLGGGAAETGQADISYPEARLRLQQRLLEERDPGPDDEALISEMRSRGLRAVAERPTSFGIDYGVGILAVLGHSNAGALFRLFETNPEAPGSAGSGLSLLMQGRWRDAAGYFLGKGPAYGLVFFLQLAQILCYYALAATALRRPGAPRGVGLVVALSLCLLLLSGGGHGNSRYRAPLVPAICVLAGIGLARRSGSAETTSCMPTG